MGGKRKQRAEPTTHPTTHHVTPLPMWEMWAYVGVWVAAVGYSIYSVYIASNDYIENLNEYYLASGWKILDRRKDTSNFEWDFWTYWFLELWPWLVGHVGISLVTGHTSQYSRYMPRRVVQLLYSHIVLAVVLSPATLLLLWAHLIIIYVATLTRSKVVVWVTSLGLLTTLNVNYTVDPLKLLVDKDPFERKFYLILFLVAMTHLRYTSVALEILSSNSGSAQSNTAAGMGEVSSNPLKAAHYIFYIPLMFTGPVITYDNFYLQLQTPSHFELSVWSALTLARKVVRVVWWAGVIEYSLHYLYFNSIHLDTSLMERLPLWALAGVGYCHGQFFMVKYVVFYGIASILAGFDGIQTPDGPKCIARITQYSHMWRYFDRGFYSFMKRYIYVPMGGSRAGRGRQAVATVACFMFIYAWHGAEEYLAIWSALNLLGIVLETLGGWVTAHPTVATVEAEYLSPAAIRRLHALLTVPLFMMSALAIFCFFGGKLVGLVYLHRLVIGGFPVSMMCIVVSLYCCIQVSTEVAAWEKRKQHLE